MSMTRKQAYQKLKEVDDKSANTVSFRLGLVTQGYINDMCKTLEINRSRFIRIALSHFDSYLSQLSKEELAAEVRRMKQFD